MDHEVKWISQSGGKTDKVDARKLAHLVRGNLLPRPVHVVKGRTRELRELVSAREQLQGKRVALINSLRGYIRQEGVRFPAKFFQRPGWEGSLEKLTLGPAQRVIFKSFMEAIEALKRSEGEITARMLQIQDSRCELLETIPAIGKIASRVLVGALDEAERFDNQKCVANYGALTPTIY